eukprot:comp20440_c0_seq1/m.25980 comp20440_c0_seq1/g.25980  ORF comp20440_c0_seq1/g.25980 comp20440_c0_seq1/m.25980 type:complete len:317 (-) comp20440_c0_seq1:30-980(-)
MLFTLLAAVLAVFIWLYARGYFSFILPYVKLGVQPLHKTQWKSAVKRDDFKLPPLTRQLPFKVDAEQLASYFAVCKLPTIEKAGQIPFLFIEAVGISECMNFLSQPDYPFPLLGAVHVKNYFKQTRALLADEALTLNLQVRPAVRPVKRGTEVDVEMFVTDAAGTKPWEAVLTFLHMHKQTKEITAPPPETEPFTAAQSTATEEWSLAEDTGRKYAAVSMDYNPIHLYAVTAKLLGFARAIAHGMYTTARAYGACERTLETQGDLAFPLEGTAAYKRPTFLPGKAELRMMKEGQGVKYVLVDTKGKLMQEGVVRKC